MDFRLALIAVVLVGTAAGLAAPDGPLDQPGPAASATDSAGSPHLASLGTGGSEWDSGAVLSREGDGHFYAELQMDGQPYRMLVDTGASVVALTAADAEAMGLEWREDEVAPIAQGAGGPVWGVHATIPHLALGQHEVQRVPAVIIPEGLEISLLGQSFLGTLGSVRIDGDRMILSGEAGTGR